MAEHIMSSYIPVHAHKHKNTRVYRLNNKFSACDTNPKQKKPRFVVIFFIIL